MSSIGSRFKLLGLCLLALCGLTAFVAASAQGNWLENGVEVTANKSVLAKAHTTIELSIPSLNMEFRCTTLTASGIKLVGSSTKAEGKVAFSGCTAWSPANLATGDEQPNCKPSEPIVWGGVALIKLLAKTKGGTFNNYVLFEPEVGRPFTTITLPGTCGFAETSNMTGLLVAECGVLVEGAFTFEDCGTSRVTHLLRLVGSTVMFEGVEAKKEVEDEFKFGANKLSFPGIAAVELVSQNPWAGHV